MPPADLDQLRERGRREVEAELADRNRRVEGAAERDVGHDRSAGRLDGERPCDDVGGNVAEAHRSNPTALDARDGLESSARDVQDDPAVGRVDHAALEGPGDERDRPVAAGGRVPGVVEEDRAEMGALVVAGQHEAAVHVGMAAGLEDEQLADAVVIAERRRAPLEHRRPLQQRCASGDDAKRLAGGVVVGGLDLHLRTGDPRC